MQNKLFLYLDKYLRKLSQKIRFVNLYYLAKDFHQIKIFNNTTELTNLQMIFLSYIYSYVDLLRDVDTKKVDKIVLTDVIYEEAYKKYKREKGYDVVDTKQDNKQESMKIFFKQ